MGSGGLGQNMLTRLTPQMSAAFRASGFWGDETIYGIAQAHADASPDKPAMCDGNAALTFAELVGLADSLAGDLARAGLRPGDRVAAWLSSRVEFGVFFLACSRNGYVFCPSLHRNHTVEEIGELLQHMRARALVAEEGYGADVDRRDIFELSETLATLKKVYRLPPPAPRTAASIGDTLFSCEACGEAASGSADQVFYLAFTSGTTGQAKGVMHSNNTLLANARAIARDWKFGTDSVIYTLSPLSHNLGFGALVLAILSGGSIVLHDLPRGASLLDRLRDIGATFVFGVPAHAMDLLAEIEDRGGADLAALKGFRISGAAVSSTIVERLVGYGIVTQSGYGMTEAGSHHYTLPDDAPELITGTSGRACPGYEVAIFSADDFDRRLRAGEIGHIGGRGASLMLGYFDNQQSTEDAFNRQGWFMTGDLGRLDDRGYLQITGRIKDIIIRGGHNIHPARIEQLAMRHPRVERAAAVPVKDQRLGEKVCIVVMARPGIGIDPQDLLSHLHAEGLSKYDMPEYFLQVDEIPLGASGKMQKRALMPAIQGGGLTPRPVRWEG